MTDFLLALVGLVLAFSADWAYSYFGLSCFEQIIFHLKVPLEGTNTEFLKDWCRKCFAKGLIPVLIAAALNFIDVYQNYYHLICVTIFWCCIVYALIKVKVIEYIINQFRSTDLYERYYVDGKKIEITFPAKKRNLIMLYVESLETTYTSKENGGNYRSDLIKEITDIAKENINFSHQEQLGGAYVVAGTGWTTGGLVAQSSGVPLCVPPQIASFNDERDFLPGAYALSDVLEKEGYEQEFLIGSEALFGGRKFYYDKHGHFKIYDLNEAHKQHKIPEDYRVFWGYEDEKLFEFAKEEVTRLANLDRPFHLTMLTVDTHHPYGYIDRNYKDEYPERLSNIIRGNSKKIGEFMDWLKKQPFYEDTTILICGDHVSMAAEYINSTYDKNYDRTVFNTFIHAQADAKNLKNRIFTSFDIYPTILSALGAKISGDRLGLGVNLFSGQKTIAEEIGVKKLDKELRKQSKYYKEYILKS